MKKIITKIVKNCATCGNKFYVFDNATGKLQKYCSIECRNEMAGRRNKKGNLVERKCANCEESFIPKVSNQRFCSTDCRIIDEKKGYFIIYERDQFRCIYCGRSPIIDNVSLHVDHIISVVDGGKDISFNLVTACSQCNLLKSDIKLKPESIVLIQNEVKRRNLISGINDLQTIKLFMGAERRLVKSLDRKILTG